MANILSLIQKLYVLRELIIREILQLWDLQRNIIVWLPKYIAITGA